VIRRWLRSLLGVDEVLARLDALEGRGHARLHHEPDGVRAAVDGALPPGWVGPGPGGNPDWAYEAGGHDVPEPTNLGGYL
jgi:hypothetical protein